MSAGKATGGRGAVRMWGRRNRELRLRKRRLTPGVVLLSLMMLPGLSLTALAAPANADPLHVCTACPNNPSLCEPNCGTGGGGGGCPVGTLTVSVAVTNVNPTNATMTITYSSGSNLNVTWGNSTNYGLWDNTTNGPWPFTVFLNYLQPSWTYYYKVQAYESCWTGATSTGHWTTGIEPSTVPLTGVVYDVNGTYDHSGNVAVYTQCADSGIVPPSVWSKVSFTNSLGQYSIQSWLYSGYTPYYPCQGYDVQVLNWVASYTGVGTSNVWLNHWNESIVVWAPQVVNFGLPTAITTWVPMAEAFVHNQTARAIEAGNSYFKSTYTTYTNTGQYYYSSVGWNNGGTFTANPDQNIIDLGQFNTTGDLRMNAMGNRTPYIDAIQYWGNPLRSNDVPTYASDPEALSNFNQNTCQFWKQARPQGNWWNDSVNISGTAINKVTAGTYLTFGVGIGIGLDFGLTGIGIGVGPDISFVIVHESSSITVIQNSQWAWQIHYTYPGTHYYSVCLDSGGPTDTVVMHIWESDS